MTRERRRGAALAACALALTGCDKGPEPVAVRPPVAREAPWFREVPAASGFAFRHEIGDRRRYWIPETVTGGVALLDVEGDGDLDVYMVQAGGDPAGPRETAPENRLFRNDGGLRFTDVTDAAGVGDKGYGMGVACADVDRDGDVDLFVTNLGPDVLYLNRGDGTFEDASSASGLDSPGFGASAAFRDLDGDRFPELYVTNYVIWAPEKEIRCGTSTVPDYCSPVNYNAPAPDLLYRNRGDGTFEDVSAAAGLRAAYGNGLGVVIDDLDRDGRVDVYVANDGTPNQWWRGVGTLVFEDAAVLAGCAVNIDGTAEAGMGVQAADLDEDGDLDLLMTHIRNESNTLYRNEGRGTFTDATVLTGLALPSRGMTGFGMGLCDFDQDGRLDLFVANGRVSRSVEQSDEPAGPDPYAEADQVFRGLGGLRFEELAGGPLGPGATPYAGRGAAFGDLDGDGDVDVVLNNSSGPAQILENVAARGGSLVLGLLDRDGIEAEGARVTLSLGGRKLHRRSSRAWSYCSSNDARVHFGTGSEARVEDLVVTWPDGAETSVGTVELAPGAATFLELRQP